MKTISQLESGEKEAIRDYGARKKGTKGTESKLMGHIQGEEKGHYKELRKLGKRKSSRR